MDKKLDIIQHLYDEAADRASFRELMQDEEVGREYQALSEVKFRLDHRKRERPDPAVIDHIMAAAASEPVAEKPVGWRFRRRDRGAVAPHKRQRGALRMVGATLAMVVVLSIGLWPLMQEETVQQAPVLAEEEADRAMMQTPAPQDSAPAAAMLQAPPPGFQAVSGRRVAASSVPDWDDADDVRRLHRRIEMLKARSDKLEWGEPAVPLEMMPSAPSHMGLRPAGARDQ